MIKEEFDNLIKKAKSGDEEAFNIVLEKSKPVLKSLSIKYSQAYSKLEYEDLYSTALEGFWEALTIYNPNNPSFLNFLKRVIILKFNNEVRLLKAEKRSYLKEVDWAKDEFISQECLNETLIIKEFREKIKDIMVKYLTDYEVKVYSLYYNDYSPAQISNILNLDTKSVHNAIYRAENKIIKKYKEMCNT